VIPARKRWGQHFLVRPETANRIVDAARIGPEDTVVEVGPGDGALTRPLAERAARVLAIEIDPLRAEALRREFVGRAGVRIAGGDALGKTFREWLSEAGWEPPAIFVSNLPYNAATAILLNAIEEEGVFSRAVGTVQKEVARRFVAVPGDDGYGYLSVRAAAAARGRVLFDLPAGAFRPPPKVKSSVLELTPRPAGIGPEARQGALRLASLAFRWRRKTVPNALSSAADRRQIERELVDLGRNPRARPEDLSLEDYAALAERLNPA
jgi:16S rRNA (adenine1518-N6/adenine1519-N6)-dimethyltransferase